MMERPSFVAAGGKLSLADVWFVGFVIVVVVVCSRLSMGGTALCDVGQVEWQQVAQASRWEDGCKQSVWVMAAE